MPPTLDQVAYANRLEQIAQSEESTSLQITDLGRFVIAQICVGRPIRDYWDLHDPIWDEIRPIRETDPAFSHPLPTSFGVKLHGIVVFLRNKCRPAVFPAPFVNIATRAIGLYCLVRIGDWVCRYMNVFGDSEDHMRPFRNFPAGARTCVEKVVLSICHVLTLIGRSEMELVRANVYHVHIMSALRMLYSHLRFWPDSRLEHSVFRRFDSTMRVIFDLNATEGYLDGND